MTASAMAAPLPPVVPGKVMNFKDWAIGCDNGLACQAVALGPKNSAQESLSIVVTRAEGINGEFAIAMTGETSRSDRFRVVIDGKVADTGTTGVGNKSIRVTGADAMKLARAMSKGNGLKLIDGSGTLLGTASLAGLAAAFRYADAVQGRVGSRGAIIAVGPKMPTAKKAIIPVISANKIITSDILPDAAALVALSESTPCTKERNGPTEDSAYSLGTGPKGPQALVLLNCGSGAYNFSVGAYVGTRDVKGKWTFAPARFDHNKTRLDEKSDLLLLVNSAWESSTQSMSSHSKGRGIGDCGSSENYVWDGTMFRLTSATVMTECRGSLDWIPVWRAQVNLSG